MADKIVLLDAFEDVQRQVVVDTARAIAEGSKEMVLRDGQLSRGTASALLMEVVALNMLVNLAVKHGQTDLDMLCRWLARRANYAVQAGEYVQAGGKS